MPEKTCHFHIKSGKLTNGIYYYAINITKVPGFLKTFAPETPARHRHPFATSKSK